MRIQRPGAGSEAVNLRSDAANVVADAAPAIGEALVADVQRGAPISAVAAARNLATTLPPETGPLRTAFDNLQTIGGGPAESRLLDNNLDSWNARWEMLEGATTSIDATYFSLEKDVFGTAFLGFLLKKQLSGVKTRLMTDAMADNLGQRGFTKPLRGKDYLQELVNHGGEATIYHPLWQRPFELLRGDYSPLASNHDKILVVDGLEGITGGRNIGIDYLTEAVDRPGAWRDLDVAVRGAGPAKALTAAMDAELVDKDIARPVSPDRFGNWVKRDIELIGAYVMMDLWLKDPPLSGAEKTRLRSDPAAQAELTEALVQRTLARLPSELPVSLRREPSGREVGRIRERAAELVSQLEARGSRRQYDARPLAVHDGEAVILDQTSAAGKRENDFATALTALADAAQKEIVIENPYVVLTEQMVEAMARASERGVEIKIITNSPLSTDSDVTQAFFLEDWAYLLARVPTARVFVATGDRKFHSKSAVMDGKLSLVTTYNLDLLSGYVNSEVGAAVWSPSLAKELGETFEKDLATESNGFLEYTVKRDADGHAIVRDGKPIPTFGPEDHLPAEVLEEYESKRKLWGHTLRDNLDAFEPLRHPPLPDHS